ncbi:MAG: hypothetical protein KAT46_06495 [Deltaproteobacteria bacterium]|nr:hypothetical protein [Deltaproteobacteria bacterium]
MKRFLIALMLVGALFTVVGCGGGSSSSGGGGSVELLEPPAEPTEPV